MAAVGASASAVHALVTYGTNSSVKASQTALIAVYAPDQVKHVRASQIHALVPYATSLHPLVPKTSQIHELVVWGSGTGSKSRTRAWTFDLDGHTFYVLDLGTEGTFLYDLDTKQWCEFRTTGYTQWNMHHGAMWGTAGRIVGADGDYPYSYELVPDATMDEGFRTISHEATGGLMTRSRVYLSVDAVRVSGSIGALDEDTGATFSMRFSDDGGQTWSSYYTVDLVQGDTDQNVEWTSLGSFMMPGRVFEFSDVGGMLRIDGVDVGIEDFDEDNVGGNSNG